MLKPFIAHLAERRDLSEAAAFDAMHIIMSGQATPAQIAGFLVALRQKGESETELLGFVRCLRSHVVPLEHSENGLVDTCGTGGDGSGTLNVSTAAAVVAAACGVRVAKHGNRSVSSRCGSADLLEAWGVKLDLTPVEAARCLKSCGITFLFAPLYHPAMKHAAAPRRELGLRTVFNLMGPLTNPAGVRRQVMGVFHQDWVEPVARVLARLEVEHALVVASHDGLDEISPAAPTRVCEVKGDSVRTYDVTPEELDVPRQSLESIRGGDAAANSEALRTILGGQPHAGAHAVALNAGAALYVAGLAPTMRDGVNDARDMLASGTAWSKLERWAAWTQAQQPTGAA